VRGNENVDMKCRAHDLVHTTPFFEHTQPEHSKCKDLKPNFLNGIGKYCRHCLMEEDF